MIIGKQNLKWEWAIQDDRPHGASLLLDESQRSLEPYIDGGVRDMFNDEVGLGD
jgi:hypothetical protein